LIESREEGEDEKNDDGKGKGAQGRLYAQNAIELKSLGASRKY